jgi:adenylosuccinate lyase/3-carboxy-cis,cis-muconate cycloisomerase
MTAQPAASTNGIDIPFADGIGLIGSVFTRHWLDREATALWTDRAVIQSWIDVEIALARAQGEIGLIPAEAADTIAERCDLRRIDMARIVADAAVTLHPFVPVLRQLEEMCGSEAGGYLHWGATTQNIFDTGQALQLKKTQSLLLACIDGAMRRLADLASQHRSTLQAGRTHGQHALPISFGFKLAGWLAEIRRHRERIVQSGEQAFVAAMGGAVGSYAAMAGQGRAVQARLAELLGLGSIDIPMRASCDRIADYVGVLSLFAATVEKIGLEVVFLQRDEIGEASESFHYGKIGSSTMAQKRNPSHALNLVGMARLLRSRAPVATEQMIRMGEGDAAAGNVLDVVLPEAAILGVSLASGLGRLVEGLDVDVGAMRRNLDISGGLIMSEAVMIALGEKLGRGPAHHLLYDAAVESVSTARPLADVLASRAELRGIDVAGLLDPSSYLGEAMLCVDDEVRRSSRAVRAHPITKAAE